MSHPVERIRLFIAEQHRHLTVNEAQAFWANLVPDVLPALDAVLDVVRCHLEPGQFLDEPLASRTDPTRSQYPLVVAFSRRAPATHPRSHHGPRIEEIGASALFRCDDEGLVRGYRYPFHDARTALEAECFVCLGTPHEVTAEAVADAVADFVEWAAVGGGCNGQRLRFAAPATLPFARVHARMPSIAA